MEITGNQWESQETNGNHRKPIKIKRNQWKSRKNHLEIKGHQWKLRETNGNQENNNENQNNKGNPLKSKGNKKCPVLTDEKSVNQFPDLRIFNQVSRQN